MFSIYYWDTRDVKDKRCREIATALLSVDSSDDIGAWHALLSCDDKAAQGMALDIYVSSQADTRWTDENILGEYTDDVLRVARVLLDSEPYDSTHNTESRALPSSYMSACGVIWFHGGGEDADRMIKILRQVRNDYGLQDTILPAVGTCLRECDDEQKKTLEALIQDIVEDNSYDESVRQYAYRLLDN